MSMSIIVPLDGSPFAERGLPIASKLARRSALALAFVTSVNLLITSRVVEHFRGRRKHLKPTDADSELGAYGIANVCAGMFGAPMSVGIPARSLANVRCGGTTRRQACPHGCEASRAFVMEDLHLQFRMRSQCQRHRRAARAGRDHRVADAIEHPLIDQRRAHCGLDLSGG